MIPVTEPSMNDMYLDKEPDDGEAPKVLFSVNPITGQVESYTSEGQFIGIIETTGDDIARRIREEEPPPEEEEDPDDYYNRMVEEMIEESKREEPEEWEE